MNLNDIPKLAWNNRTELKLSELCGCYYCLTIFPTHEVSIWTDKGQTGICPHCENDCLIPQSSGVAMEKETLESLRSFWLGEAKPDLSQIP